MKYLVLLFAALFVLGSCKKDKVEDPEEVIPVKRVKISMQPTYNGENLELNAIYQTNEGYRVRFSRIACIGTEFKNGSSTLTSSAVFDYEKGTTFLDVEGNYSNFSSLTWNVGVGVDRNHADPSILPTTDPLNILNIGTMHWGWNPGYIFIQVEGMADTTTNQTGAFNQSFVYHIGNDDNLQLKTISNLNWTDVGNNTHEANLKLEMDKFFSSAAHTIDVKVEKSSHSLPSQTMLSTKAIENFTNAIIQ